MNPAFWGELTPAEKFEALFSGQQVREEDVRKDGFSNPNREAHSAIKEGERMRWPVLKEIYCERTELRSTKTHSDNVRRSLDLFTKYCSLIDKTVEEITSLDIERFIAKRKKDTFRGKPLSPQTINNNIEHINACFRYAGPRENKGSGRNNLAILPFSPFAEYLPTDDLDPVNITTQQIRTYIDATRFATSPIVDGCDPRTFWIVAMVIDSVTALRRGSLLKVARPSDHMLFEQRQLFLPGRLNKSRRNQYLSLGNRDDFLQMVASLPSKPGEPLLPWKHKDGRPMTDSHFSQTMCKFQRRAGTSEEKRLRCKDLRSTAATVTLDEFGDAVAKKKLGHSATTTTIYKHYQARKPTNADEQASDFIASNVMALIDGVDLPGKTYPGGKAS